MIVNQPPRDIAGQQAVAAPAWVIVNSLATLPIRAAAADTIIVLDPHPLVCLAGTLQRRLRHPGRRTGRPWLMRRRRRGERAEAQ